MLETDENVDNENKNPLIFVPDETDPQVENENANKWNYEVLKDSLKNIKNEAHDATGDQNVSLTLHHFNYYGVLVFESFTV